MKEKMKKRAEREKRSQLSIVHDKIISTRVAHSTTATVQCYCFRLHRRTFLSHRISCIYYRRHTEDHRDFGSEDERVLLLLYAEVVYTFVKKKTSRFPNRTVLLYFSIREKNRYIRNQFFSIIVVIFFSSFFFFFHFSLIENDDNRALSTVYQRRLREE